MTPTQKAKLMLFLKGVALAMLTAGLAYASTHWKEVLGVLPYSIYGAATARAVFW